MILLFNREKPFKDIFTNNYKWKINIITAKSIS